MTEFEDFAAAEVHERRPEAMERRPEGHRRSGAGSGRATAAIVISVFALLISCASLAMQLAARRAGELENAAEETQEEQTGPTLQYRNHILPILEGVPVNGYDKENSGGMKTGASVIWTLRLGSTCRPIRVRSTGNRLRCPALISP